MIFSDTPSFLVNIFQNYGQKERAGAPGNAAQRQNEIYFLDIPTLCQHGTIIAKPTKCDWRHR